MDWKLYLLEWLDWSWKSTAIKLLENELSKTVSVWSVDFYSSWIYHKKRKILAWWNQNVVPFLQKFYMK